MESVIEETFGKGEVTLALLGPWLRTLENVEEYAILTTVDRVPPEVIAPAQREFAKALLRVTVGRVKEMGR
jgi:hypothetical protein